MPMNPDQLAQLNEAMSKWHTHYDEFYRQVGRRAPQPVADEHPNQYRRRTLNSIQQTYLCNHPTLANVTIDKNLDNNSLRNFENMFLEAAPKEVYNPKNTLQDYKDPKTHDIGIKMIPVLDESGRIMRHDFVGAAIPGTEYRVRNANGQMEHHVDQTSFVTLMPNYREGRRVVKFADPADYASTRARNEFGMAGPPSGTAVLNGVIYSTGHVQR